MRDAFAWARGLRCCKPDQFCASEGKGRNDKNGTEALESVVKRAGIVPVLGTDISLRSDSAAVNNDTQDDESDTPKAFDGTQNEFSYCCLVLAT